MENREEMREWTGMTKDGVEVHGARKRSSSYLNYLRQRPLLLDNVFNILLTTLNNLMGLQEFVVKIYGILSVPRC